MIAFIYNVTIDVIQGKSGSIEQIQADQELSEHVCLVSDSSSLFLMICISFAVVLVQTIMVEVEQ